MLATISDRLKVFEFLGSQLNLVSQKDGFNGKLNTVSWNHTNQVVAVAGTARVIHLVQASNGQFLSEVPFSSVQERAILHSDTHITDDITSISFSNSSRYLASSSGNSVHIWDLKRRNLRVHKKIGTGIISSLLFLSDGTKVITGNQKGNLDIWDFEQSSDVTGLVTTEFTPRGITSMDIISGSQTKLGCGYDDGSISIWDLSTCLHLRHQKVHSGSLTGLSFSPKNSRLLATAGLDGRINLVDTASKSISDPSASVNVGERLSTISFSCDAIHSAVGTENGRVFIYDWRNLRSPVVVNDSHIPSPINSIRFQNSIKPSAAPSSAKKMSSFSVQEASSLNSVKTNISDVTLNSDISISPKSNTRNLPATLTKNVNNLSDMNDHVSIKSKLAPPSSVQSISSIKKVVGPPDKQKPNSIDKVEMSIEDYKTLTDSNNPLTLQMLQETLDNFRYDIHKELQGIIREQARQFAMVKEDNGKFMKKIGLQLEELLKANKELREENERLRHIY